MWGGFTLWETSDSPELHPLEGDYQILWRGHGTNDIARKTEHGRYNMRVGQGGS